MLRECEFSDKGSDKGWRDSFEIALGLGDGDIASQVLFMNEEG
jgi:hypothetical protein